MLKNGEKLSDLIDIFDQLFAETENTRLQCFAEEPFYKAATKSAPAIIFSRDNYYSSALHEIAHWCIAGKERRALDDYGYWYKPEGRNADEQIEFEQVEIKPQAIEWALSLASSHQFHFSADNIAQGIEASESFKQAVYKQLSLYVVGKQLPLRAKQLFEKLNLHFRGGRVVNMPKFSFDLDDTELIDFGLTQSDLSCAEQPEQPEQPEQSEQSEQSEQESVENNVSFNRTRKAVC